MSISRRVLVLLALVIASMLVTVPPAFAANATGKNFILPAVTHVTYSISGTVRSNVTSLGVANVEVTATSTTGFGPFRYGSAVSGANGAYTISHLLPGSYDLRFDPPRTANLQHGYRTATAPAFFSVSAMVAVTITTASVTAKDIRLPLGFKISGKVTRSNGITPIVNADVSAFGLYGSDDVPTNATGNFVLEGLSPGSYQIEFGHDVASDNQTGCWYAAPANKFAASCVAHTLVTITTVNVAGVNPKIPNSLQITGFVKTRATTPLPIANASVSAAGPEDSSASTDATGKYTLVGLNPGAYKITVDGPYASRYVTGDYTTVAPNYWTPMVASAATVTISAPVTTLQIIKPGTGFYIKGKITNMLNAPLSFVSVEATGGAGTFTTIADSFTDGMGSYTVGPVLGGTTYRISVDPSFSSDPTLKKGWYLKSLPNDYTATAAAATSLLIHADVLGINMRLPKGASISGTVTITGGAPCAFCFMAALNSSGSLVAFGSTSGTGAYSIGGLPAGSYFVEAFGSSSIIDATHVRVISDGLWKAGLPPNYAPSTPTATLIAIS